MDSSVSCITIFVFLTLATASVLARVDVFLSDQQGLSDQQSLCPQQTVGTPRATFTCTSTGSLQWFVNGVLALLNPVGDDGIRTGGGARAVIISNNGVERTSVLRFDSFPTTSFTISCNQEQLQSVDFAVAPQRPSSVVASYIEVGEFLNFNISFSPPGDAQTNFTYRVQIGDEEVMTEQLWLFTAIAADSDNNNNLMVTVTAINECEQEGPSSSVQAERVSTDMPSTTATTGRVFSTEAMEEITTPSTTVNKKFLSTGIAAWTGISIILIVILVLCCVGLLVYIIHQKKKVILYLMKRIADLEAKQGQTMSTLSGKQPDN